MDHAIYTAMGAASQTLNQHNGNVLMLLLARG